MSRAVPSSFSEYLIDTESSTFGIRCDGGIMPLRTDPDPRSFWYKKCLRGEDLVFLCEAVNARGLYGGNRLSPFDTFYDPYGPPVSAQKMAFLDQRIGAYFTSGRWTDLDPSASLGAFHSFGGTQPSVADVVAYVKSAFHPIARHGNGNSFLALDSAPVENMFKDVGLLNYTFLKDFDPMTGLPISPYGSYAGLNLSTTQYLHTVKQTGHYGESSPRVETADSQRVNWYAWRDYDRENYDYDPPGLYPGGLRSAEVTTTTGVEITVSEGGGTWRSYNRYLAVRPYCVVEARNRYSASWSRSSDDSGTTYEYDNAEYVWCPLPVTAYIDMLTPQTVVLDSQSMPGWAASVFTAAGLEQYASDLAGQYVTTGYKHARERDCTISAPNSNNAVWIAHFLYCNLEGVVPSAQPQQAGQP